MRDARLAEAEDPVARRGLAHRLRRSLTWLDIHALIVSAKSRSADLAPAPHSTLHQLLMQCAI
jgi:hypothetical protein